MKNSAVKDESLRKTYGRLFTYVKPYRVRLVLGILFSFIFGGSTGAIIPSLAKVIEKFEMLAARVSPLKEQVELVTEGGGDVSASELPVELMVGASIGILLVVLLRGVGFYFSKYYIQWVGSRVVMDVRNSMFAHIHRLPIQYFSKSRSGDLITRLTSDTGMIQQVVSTVIGDFLRELSVLVAAMSALIYSSDWRLTLITLLVFPLCLIPVNLFGKRVGKASKMGQEKVSDLLSTAQETISGAQIVKAFNMEAQEVEKFKGHARGLFSKLMKIARAQAAITPMMELFSALGMIAVLLFAFKNGLPLSEVMAFGSALVIMYKPIKTMSKLHLRLRTGMVGATRIFEVLDTEVLIADQPDADNLDASIESIVMDRVGFAYDQDPILSEVSLNVAAGECVAFVGSSGAGKTTLVNLVPRFYEVSSGSISINGKDLRDYSLHSLREQIGVVTQQTILFNLSVADNIAYGQPNATREQIIDAARRANAHEFIEKMENGYDTVIGERGSRISGGQAQRLAIARALLKNPPILILDEATSALDTESERLVQAALDELMSGRTVLVIAHRLSTIRHADKIVVMDKGRVVETGTHDELLAQAGKYKYLHDIQFNKAD